MNQFAGLKVRRRKKDAPRRVLFILQSAAVGGMETHAIDLAAEYVRRGITVAAVVPEWSRFDEVGPRFEAVGVPVARLDTDAREGRSTQIRRWLRLLRITRSFDPDVVHLHTPGATGGLAVLLIVRVASRATIVVTEHDVPAARPHRWDSLTRAPMDLLTDALVAVSRRNATLRRERLRSAPRQFAAVLNGVPVEALPADARAANRATTRQELGLPTSAFVVGSLVRLAEGKGMRELVEGFALVRAQRECNLLLVGDGPLRPELEALARSKGVEQHVSFAGRQLAPARFLDAMDVFVLAVPAGSMSIALLEAMSRGLPCVISFCGPEEAVIPEETGLCAPPGDAEGLSRVLLRVIDDDQLRARLGRAAEEHVQRHFSVRRVADDLLEIYSSADTDLPTRLRADGPPNALPGVR